ncbi:DNA alkylation repair protein [Aquimarina aquimarini]|uniref:DNA alkylation repair protein n=1 Tax=Aquimarina aquimarini TaxID=1191734 RepID=UPI000D54FB9D|nr:DNA alkylation repair protein [Aquimarina aquimarini]
MAELLKHIYSHAFFEEFTTVLQKVIPYFNTSSFIKQIYDNEWEKKELKQRMRHITVVLQSHLQPNYSKNVDTLLNVIKQLQKEGIKENSLEYMFFPDFIEFYGINDYDTSIRAIEEITQFTSCEFAIRPFLIKFPKKGIIQMTKWSTHTHYMVRRLSSEGCRPRLPWAIALPFLKKDPTPILPILKNLKEDESELVRRSVANNLNDIAKDHPTVVTDIAKNWIDKSKEIDWLVKHGCRTLLKQGNPEIMSLFGFRANDKIKIKKLKILTPIVQIGNTLEFTFELHNTDNRPSKIRLEYGLYYQKANGNLSKKVFKISEKAYPKNSITTIYRKQSFKIITTRKFHLGLHQLSIIINGNEFKKHAFKLDDKKP